MAREQEAIEICDRAGCVGKEPEERETMDIVILDCCTYEPPPQEHLREYRRNSLVNLEGQLSSVGRAADL